MTENGLNVKKKNHLVGSESWSVLKWFKCKKKNHVEGSESWSVLLVIEKESKLTYEFII